MMRAVGLALLSISVSQAIYDLDYFDNLRRNGNESNVTAIKSPSNTERLWNVTLDNGDTFNLAQFSVFLPFSDGTNIRDAAGNEMAAALMAVHHFNNPELSPHLTLTEDLEAIADCKIKLTADFHDTRYSPIDTTRLFTNILQRENVFQEPAPSGVIGAYRSAVTSPLAILTGVNGIPQVSHASTSTDFDVKEQYPYFGRTVTSSTGEAAVLVQLFQSLGSTHVGVLFVTDAFGSALQKAFQDAASEASIVTDSVAFSYSADLSGDEIPNAVASLKGTQFRHLLIISFELHYDTIMTAAYDQGLVGDDYLWIFDGMDYITFHRNLTYPEGTCILFLESYVLYFHHRIASQTIATRAKSRFISFQVPHLPRQLAASESSICKADFDLRFVSPMWTPCLPSRKIQLRHSNYSARPGERPLKTTPSLSMPEAACQRLWPISRVSIQIS